MLIGVISDTHDNLPMVARAVEVFNERNVDQVLHAGDLVSPFVDRSLKDLKAPLLYIFGNNEGEIVGIMKLMGRIGQVERGPVTREFGGKRLYLHHFHHNVDTLAKSGEYDIIVYGHTHEIVNKKVGGTLVVNPGECCGWLTGKCTVAIIDTEKMEAEIVEL